MAPCQLKRAHCPEIAQPLGLCLGTPCPCLICFLATLAFCTAMCLPQTIPRGCDANNATGALDLCLLVHICENNSTPSLKKENTVFFCHCWGVVSCHRDPRLCVGVVLRVSVSFLWYSNCSFELSPSSASFACTLYCELGLISGTLQTFA